MPGYIPPHCRNKPTIHIPKKLSLKPKAVDWVNLKSKDQLFEEYRLKNYGKADAAWDGLSGNDSESTEPFVVGDKSPWSFHNPKIYTKSD